jgi:hypothetical protein
MPCRRLGLREPEPDALLKDFHWIAGQVSRFLVDVVDNKAYQVTVVTGSYAHDHNASSFRVYDTAVWPRGPLTQSAVTPRQQFQVLRFENVPVADVVGEISQLALEMWEQGVNNWGAVINALDIRPENSVGIMTIARTGWRSPCSGSAGGDGSSRHLHDRPGRPQRPADDHQRRAARSPRRTRTTITWGSRS